MEIGLVTIYLLIGILSIAVFLLKKQYSYWKDRGIPHDAPSILYGNMKGFGKTTHFYQYFRHTYNKFKGTGPFAGFYMFFNPVAVVLDLDLAKNVLIKDFSNFDDRGMFFNEKDDPLTGHLFSLDGKKWRRLRNKLSPTFTSGKMKFMYPTVLNVAKQFGDVFGQMVQKDSVVEIKELLARFTTDVIGTCAFGIECNSLQDPNAEFRVMGKRTFTDKRHSTIVEGLMISFPNVARFLGMRIITDDVHEFFMRIVRETVDYRETNKIERNDFMNLLIELKNKKGDDNLGGLTLEEVAAQAFIFFLAGFETSSTTMGFAMYELAQNPEIQERTRSEVNKVLERHNGEFTYECIQDMAYLDQVIQETLRKYSIVPFLQRRALNDYQVPNSNLVIEKNTVVVIPSDAFHFDPEIYPDPEVFNPDRFSPEESKDRHQCAWLPFGDGPRNCIGLRFGKMQTRLGLAILLTKFKFSVCSKTPIPIVFDFTTFLLSSKDGIYLKVEKV